jgi:long-chain acyl-CoA synthetase
LADHFQSLRALLEARAAAAPDKTFLLSAGDGRRWTYGEFDAAVNRTARMLAARAGVGKGDAVSLLLPNGPEYVIAYFACFKLGALAGPVNSLLKPEEIAFVVSDSEAKAMLAATEFLPAVADLRGRAPSLRSVLRFDDWEEAAAGFDDGASDAGASGEGANDEEGNSEDADDEDAGGKDTSGEDANDEGAGDGWRGVPLSKDDEAIIIYTSGTTGRPKGCLLTHGNLLANARQIAEWMGFTPADRLLTVMPLFHMNAVTVTTAAALHAGGSTVVAPRFSASTFWQTVSEHGVTSFGSVATMLSMLLAKYPEGVPESLKIDGLRFAMCGSAPVPAEVLRRFEETFGCLVVEGYGLSESTCRSTFNPPDERRRPGSCGLPIGNEMRVVDEDDAEVSDGARGEIVLRGENIFKGYFKNEEATARAFRGGWFHTGDVGYRDADGFYFIVDRKSDMIIRGGENIYPREIDELLYSHPAVAAAAAVGVPDELYGEEVAAFVQLREGRAATEQELIEFCRARLADFKCPKTVRFLAEMPKGPTGKVLKRELARLHAQGRGPK